MSPTAPISREHQAASGSAEPAVELRGLTKRYGSTTAVDGVDLSVSPGELIAVLGASGSGKTTLLRMVAGFESVSAGTISLFGRDVSRLSPADREIGMVFQNYALMPHLSVRRNIEYGLKVRGWSRVDRHERVEEMLERMRLTPFGDRLPRQLSGGQQQRVAIARALAYSPKLLLMDEPMGALDKALKQELLTEIRRVHRDFATTIFYVTHDREEALTLADRIALMSDARLADCAPVQEMYLRPRTPYAASFFAGANLLDVDVIAAAGGRPGVHQVRLGSRTHDVDGEAGPGRALLVVRPRNLTLGPVTDGWTMPAVISDLAFLGDDVRVVLSGEDLSQPLTALVPHADAVGLEVGASVLVGLSAGDCRVIDPTAPKTGTSAAPRTS